MAHAPDGGQPDPDRDRRLDRCGRLHRVARHRLYRRARPGAVMTDEQVQVKTDEDIEADEQLMADEPVQADGSADQATDAVDVDEVIEAEATEDAPELDEPQAGEVEATEGDTVAEGEDESEDAVEKFARFLEIRYLLLLLLKNRNYAVD